MAATSPYIRRFSGDLRKKWWQSPKKWSPNVYSLRGVSAVEQQPAQPSKETEQGERRYYFADAVVESIDARTGRTIENPPSMPFTEALNLCQFSLC